MCRYLQLGSREVHICHHLRARVLHLQPGVQLQEVEAPVLPVQILHGACTDVPNHLGQADSALREREIPGSWIQGYPGSGIQLLLVQRTLPKSHHVPGSPNAPWTLAGLGL